MNAEQVEAAALLKRATAARDRAETLVDKYQAKLTAAWEVLERAQRVEREATLDYLAKMDA